MLPSTPGSVESIVDAVPPLSKAFADLASAIIDSKRRAHSSFVLISGELIREELLRAINVSVDPFNTSAIKKLLLKNGRPSDFYIRIEAANKLGILDVEAYRILGCLRLIRNEFGHPKNLCSLDTEPVLSLFLQLHTNPMFKGSYACVLFEYVLYVNDVLERYLVKSGITSNISERNMPRN